MDTDATRRLIEELLEAYNAPDLDRAALLYAEGCEYINRAYGIEVKRRDAQRANMQTFLDLFPNQRCDLFRIFADEGAPPWRRSSWPRAQGDRKCHRLDSPTLARCAAFLRSGTDSW